ncbi:bifunctional diguanylate cyclase/phosphodiesterase [Mesobacterium sp. TK19101]|uniref:Bifunctional diguanylate cyclase/phosphodiesterase n=1 Tax=Mesobacterium hydrothermale TaxID=3111907 RepID=A0ABU6HGD9_9RHOB|nr:bifunctional diguanylate cyclase/phosphodiesterase [Mesobacterium sp. TK19101]MEC3861421.1 bifunctional diguanylate cyclase/phosphodiesterase [Mesobacterium sp. TK19101]
MANRVSHWVTELRRRLRQMLIGPQLLAFAPALSLAAFWFGGETVLIAVALGLPVLVAAIGVDPNKEIPLSGPRAPDRLSLNDLSDRAEAAMALARRSGRNTACLLIAVSGLDRVVAASRDGTRRALLERVRSLLREGDLTAWAADGQIAVLLHPGKLDLNAVQMLAQRLQTALEDALPADRENLHFSAAIGIGMSSRLRAGAGGGALLQAARAALDEAQRAGASGIRAQRRMADPPRRVDAEPLLVGEVLQALETGRIAPWYQPIVDARSADLTGVEALARWLHPTRGVIAPAELLPALDQAGGMERLGEIMLHSACVALQAWDRAGMDIPSVSLNFSEVELRNPRLAEIVSWELDRFGLCGDRLRIEVLESVLLTESDECLVRSINALAELGCGIDLDDFGTGQTGIAALQLVPVHRLKIDRRFVTRIDRDDRQRRLVAALIGLAERMGLETVAEGVESHGEHAVLAQLGCTHLQGYGIARPMPGDQLHDWCRAHAAKLAAIPRIAGANG